MSQGTKKYFLQNYVLITFQVLKLWSRDQLKTSDILTTFLLRSQRETPDIVLRLLNFGESLDNVEQGDQTQHIRYPLGDFITCQRKI